MSERKRQKAPRRPTMEDVAARAGVSQMTVSHVIRGAGGARLVSERISDVATSMVLGRELTHDLLSASARSQVVYFSNDDLAAGGLMHCLVEGVSVPEDLALASFNGLPVLDALPLQITTTRTPRREIGRAAARYIGSSEDASHVDLGFEVVPGQTT